MSTMFQDSHFSIWDRMVPFPTYASPGPNTALLRFFATLFQGWSLQVILSFGETTRPKLFATSEWDAAWFPKFTLCSFPITGFLLKPCTLSGMRSMSFHQLPENFLPFKAGYHPISHVAGLTSPCTVISPSQELRAFMAFIWYTVAHSLVTSKVLLTHHLTFTVSALHSH